jgi:hypothetical protein
VAPNSSSTNTEGSAQHSSVSKRDRKFSNLLSSAAVFKCCSVGQPWFGLRLPQLCHSTLEQNLGRNSTSCSIPATMESAESPVALQRSPMNAGFW